MLTVLVAALAQASWITDRQIVLLEPEERAGIDLEVGGFDLGPRRGIHQTGTVRGEVPLNGALSVAFRLPFAHVAYRNGGRAVGPGDLLVGAQAGAAPTEKLVLGAGFGASLPVGDRELGLGAGHPILRPFAGAAFQVRPGRAVALRVEDLLSLAPRLDADWDPVRGAVMDPHTPHELRIDAAWVQAGPKFWWNVGVQPNIPLQGGDPGMVAFRFAGGWRLGEGVALTARFEQPMAGRARFLWRGGLGLVVDRPLQRLERRPTPVPPDPATDEAP